MNWDIANLPITSASFFILAGVGLLCTWLAWLVER